MARDVTVDPIAVQMMRDFGEVRKDAWRLIARPAQIPDPDKPNHLYIAGRGSGKTRGGAEWIAERICCEPGRYGLVVPTLDHGITECLEENLYKIIPAAWRHWRGSVNQVDFINGSSLKLFHAERPGKVRGPNLMGKWVDEPAEMRFGMDAWTNGQMATRIARPDGRPPQTFVTGTPKRVELMLHIERLAKLRPQSYARSGGSMKDNIDNLSADVVEELLALYDGTNLGMQELDGIMVEDVEGALLTAMAIAKYRVQQQSTAASLRCMSIDPGFSDRSTADEVGIVIGQRMGTGNKAIVEVIDDCSTRGTPGHWKEYLPAKCEEHGIDVILYEGNMTGQWLKETLEGAFDGTGIKKPRFESVTSKKSKWARAEPVAALAEKGRMRMVGTFARLEAELTTWVPDTGMRSPNRLDAWAQLGRYLLIKNVSKGGTSNRKSSRRVGSIA